MGSIQPLKLALLHIAAEGKVQSRCVKARVEGNRRLLEFDSLAGLLVRIVSVCCWVWHVEVVGINVVVLLCQGRGNGAGYHLSFGSGRLMMYS